MCGYAAKYHGIGVLNTDWGDFGHVNDPAFSVPGMIYGAVFSWNGEKIPFAELNRMISRIEYGDTTGNYVSHLAEICGQSVFRGEKLSCIMRIRVLKAWNSKRAKICSAVWIRRV